ncbi:DNA-3-methyladenine glycosylase 2 [Bailinhaonella thermotolerans]|uniref:DNA-3-methyladenine glycosylase II n=1 Tax=Bailinhaonella thermotolerans TaxID=1070861 RepID=A0A3A4AU90_9ACTN|nr:DNA-3-methyladenine glycosylase 2 [Bailinhaonella thermotolerans]RJL33560.1 DNA-3-methyladenine glycosylase 2 family protein [Bailinhaonella thermotolerans]
MTLDFDACYRAVSARDRRFDGRFYTAVRTTGIYCRPICPARTPRQSNITFYRHAAAAEAAGFRPCRRCRPELSPGDPGWDYRGDLVGRALRLIDEGVVDDFGVAGLARRLHVTERHLLRLFTAELGVAPLAVARTRRLLTAKQLLTETSLPVTDVAFASGFGSVRQFNATFREAYGFAPSDLRARGRVSEPLDRPFSVRLDYRPPFDAAALLGFLASRAVPGVERVDENGYTRTVPGPGVITLTPADGHVRLRANVPDLRGFSRLVHRSRRLLDLDADPEAITTMLSREPVMARLAAARPGLRVPGAMDGFELAVRAVVGQQISVAGARTLLGRIAERAGTPYAAECGLTRLFPTAAQLADADLSGLGLTGRRVATLTALASAVASGELDLDGGDPAETVDGLLALPGIGPWTAGYIAMRALRDPDAFPAGDLALRNAMTRLGIEGEAAAEAWRPWRAYAALHLWTSLSDPEASALPRTA